MTALRQATLEDIAVLWNLRTRAIEHGCLNHYTPQVLAAWLAAPAPAALGRHIEHGGGLVAVDDRTMHWRQRPAQRAASACSCRRR